MDAVTLKRLLDLLSRQRSAHEELRAVLLEQQRALRRFDTAGLDKLRQRSDLLAERIAELEQARRTLMGAKLRLTELAERIDEPGRSRLVATAAGLRRLAEEIASINRINGAAAHNMLNHFHSVYQMLAGANQAARYGSSGRVDRPGGAFLVDAVA